MSDQEENEIIKGMPKPKSIKDHLDFTWAE